MPSSTSSFEGALAGRRWVRTWALAVLLVVSIVAAWEAAWRARGFQPSVSEDIGLWALERERADEGDGKATVIVGSSRVKTGIIPHALAEATGWHPTIQLAINFSSPVLVLENLAADPRFHGRVIVDVAPIILFNGVWPLENMVGGYLAYRDTERWSQGIDTRLSVLVESTLVLRLPELSGRYLPATLWKGEMPPPQKFFDDRDRVTHMADSVAHEPAPAGDGGAIPLGAEGLEKLVARLNVAIAGLRRNGGTAVFVEMPTSGAMAETEARLFPRAQYWDVFARNLDAPTVRIADVPELHGFVPVDGSHLGYASAVEFSRALGPVLERVLAGSPARESR